MEELRFDGRVAIVTGAGRGLGESHAKALAARGTQVVVNDLAKDTGSPAQRVADEINATGGRAVANGDDVSSPDAGEAIVAAALDNFGRIDIVINNAGNFDAASWPQDNTLDDFLRTVKIHLGGAFNVTRAAWPHFVAQKYGRVVNITSSAALGSTDRSVLSPGSSGNSGVSYATAKAGMIGFTRSLANFEPGLDIKANAVAPVAETPLFHNVTKLPNGAEIPMDASLVSPGIALLVHETCPVNGEILGVGGGRVDRLFVGATNGYLDIDLTPERLLEHWESVMDTSDFWIPEHGPAHSHRIRQDRGALLTDTN